MTPRQPGFYRAILDGKWTVAEYEGDGDWYAPATACLQESDFTFIEDTPIEMPPNPTKELVKL